jgi:hypothetical protein
MNRTIKEATVKRFFYDTHEQLKAHLSDFIAAYNFARRLKTLRGLTPYEAICKLWTHDPDRFTLDPIHQMPGLNTLIICRTLITHQKSLEEDPSNDNAKNKLKDLEGITPAAK